MALFKKIDILLVLTNIVPTVREHSLTLWEEVPLYVWSPV